jgi:CHASE3 domain sensor protein
MPQSAVISTLIMWDGQEPACASPPWGIYLANPILKTALRIGVLVLLAVIALHAYVARTNLRRIRDNAGLRLEASLLQADIANVLLDLNDMETGQRGYLLTGDPAYLKPYNDAIARLPAHFGSLRSRLAHRSQKERSLEAETESLAKLKANDSEETVRLRERGYRHRAFVIVNSDRGKRLMDEARVKLAALSAAAAGSFAEYDRETNASVGAALRVSGLASVALLALTAVVFLGFDRYAQKLELGFRRQTEALRDTNGQLERFTTTVSHAVRTLLKEMWNLAETLIETYGGFLPWQAQEQAQRMKQAAGQANQLIEDSLANPKSGEADASSQLSA